MSNYKKWPKIVMIVCALVALIGMFLPWLTASGYGQTDTKNAMDSFFDPTKWILLISIILTTVFAVLALIIKNKGLLIASGVIGIVSSVFSAGVTIMVCIGTLSLGAGAAKFSSVETSLGAGFFVSLVAIIAMFVFSIISLTVKNK